MLSVVREWLRSQQTITPRRAYRIHHGDRGEVAFEVAFHGFGAESGCEGDDLGAGRGGCLGLFTDGFGDGLGRVDVDDEDFHGVFRIVVSIWVGREWVSRQCAHSTAIGSPDTSSKCAERSAITYWIAAPRPAPMNQANGDTACKAGVNAMSSDSAAAGMNAATACRLTPPR